MYKTLIEIIQHFTFHLSIWTLSEHIIWVSIAWELEGLCWWIFWRPTPLFGSASPRYHLSQRGRCTGWRKYSLHGPSRVHNCSTLRVCRLCSGSDQPRRYGNVRRSLEMVAFLILMFLVVVEQVRSTTRCIASKKVHGDSSPGTGKL